MSSADMQTMLGGYGPAISKQLEQFFDTVPVLLHAELSDHSLAALQKLREYSLRPSKRIRGALAAFAYDYAAHTTQGLSGIQAGVALELAQNYLLIVDDVMDKSELRRGEPAMQQLYAAEYDDEHLASMLAINVGLVAQHLLNLVMTAIDEDPARVVQALQLLHKNVCITGFGQIDDLSQHVGQVLDETDLIRKYSFKSSYYTFVNPLQVGLVLGGASDAKVLQEIEKFGVAAGVAFQLHDDVLGVYGNAAKMGKSTLDDTKEGKYTLLLHHALQHGDESDVQVLKQNVGNPAITDNELQLVQTVLEKNGSKTFVEDKALWYARQAKAVLASSTFWDEQTKAMLAALVDYSVAREK